MVEIKRFKDSREQIYIPEISVKYTEDKKFEQHSTWMLKEIYNDLPPELQKELRSLVTLESCPSFPWPKGSFQESKQSPWWGHHAWQLAQVGHQITKATSSLAYHSLQRKQLFHHPSKLSIEPIKHVKTKQSSDNPNLILLENHLHHRSLICYRLVVRHCCLRHSTDISSRPHYFPTSYLQDEALFTFWAPKQTKKIFQSFAQIKKTGGSGGEGGTNIQLYYLYILPFSIYRT